MLKNSKAFSGFSVKDIDEAAKFYGETLGLDVEVNDMGMTINIAGGNHLFVYPKEDHEPATFTILNFPVDDIDKAADELIAKGIVFEKYDGFGQDERGVAHAKSPKDGPSIAWFKDPSGNILSILTN